MMIELWTDGSCSQNPGPGGWGFVVAVDGKVTQEGSGGSRATTNNRMELTAVLEGLRTLQRPTALTVVTDSSYIEQAFNKNWIASWKKRGWKRAGKNGKPEELKNADLWKAIDQEVNRHNKVRWRRVLGHSGIELNERADVLAVDACLEAGGDPDKMVELGGESWGNGSTMQLPLFAVTEEMVEVALDAYWGEIRSHRTEVDRKRMRRALKAAVGSVY